LTFQDLGNLGELIAAIATLATLVYLALQIRLNTKAVLGSTAHAIVEQESATSTLIAQHPSIYRRGNASITELNADENVVYQQIIFIEIAEVWSAFSQFQSGLIGRSDLAAYHAEWKIYMAKPGFRSIWSECRHEYPKDFCEFIDKISVGPKSAPQLQD
jgi:hypothetical protein